MLPQPKRATSRDRLLVEEEHLPAAAALCCVRELRRELPDRGSTSKPLAATSAFSASSCVHFEQQVDRTLVLPPMAVRYSVPRACNGQAVFSSIKALARRMLTNGCCSRRKDECESREENLLAAGRGGKNQIGSRIGKRDGECMRQPRQMRRIEGYSGGKLSAWLLGDVSPASVE